MEMGDPHGFLIDVALVILADHVSAHHAARV
jgi:hypothetical protein